MRRAWHCRLLVLVGGAIWNSLAVHDRTLVHTVLLSAEQAATRNSLLPQVLHSWQSVFSSWLQGRRMYSFAPQTAQSAHTVLLLALQKMAAYCVAEHVPQFSHCVLRVPPHGKLTRWFGGQGLQRRHSISLVRVAGVAANSTPVRHVLMAVQKRSDVAVFGTASYWVLVHVVAVAQRRSDVTVLARVSYSSTASHGVRAVQPKSNNRDVSGQLIQAEAQPEQTSVGGGGRSLRLILHRRAHSIRLAKPVCCASRCLQLKLHAVAALANGLANAVVGRGRGLCFVFKHAQRLADRNLSANATSNTEMSQRKQKGCQGKRTDQT